MKTFRLQSEVIIVLATVVLLGSQAQAEFQCNECMRASGPNISSIDTCGDNLELAEKVECQPYAGFEGNA